MAVSNTNLLGLLGKQVSYSWLGADGVTYQSDGELTSIAFHLHGDHEFAVDEGDYYSFSELTEFQVLDDCSAPLGTITKSPSAIDDHCSSIVDAAFTGLITDNKDFIDSLSK